MNKTNDVDAVVHGSIHVLKSAGAIAGHVHFQDVVGNKPLGWLDANSCPFSTGGIREPLTSLLHLTCDSYGRN